MNLPYINNLTTSLLSSSFLGGTPTPFLPRCASLSCFSLNQLHLFVFSHLLQCYISNKLCICIYSFFASVRNAFFTGGKDPRKNSFESLALAGLVARIPGFHPGYPGSIPGQGMKISLQAMAHCCLTEITWRT